MESYSTLSDEELALCAKAGDGEAFEELFKRLYVPTFRICLRPLGDVEDAHDATMETFVRAFIAMGKCTYKPERVRLFRSWLFRIATNVCLDVLRKRERTPFTVPLHEATAGGEEQDYEWVDCNVKWDPEAISDWRPVREAYDELDPLERVALAKRFFAEETWKEVADDMELTYSQARYLGIKAARHFAENLARRGITFEP